MDAIDEWPTWWTWELVISPHVIERMKDRGFSEIDLRMILDDAAGYRPSIVSDRFIIETSFQTKRWEVIVEPDESEQSLIVVTAYEVE